MKTIYILLVLCLNTLIALGQNTNTEIEYFFDTDPGIGNATIVNISDAANLNEAVTIPVSSLTSGIHVLHMRTINNLNKWSFYARQTFYIANFSSLLNNTITQAEYFIDSDPGVGNAQALTISSGSTINETLIIPLNGISEGIHVLHIRIKKQLKPMEFVCTPSIL